MASSLRGASRLKPLPRATGAAGWSRGPLSGTCRIIDVQLASLAWLIAAEAQQDNRLALTLCDIEGLSQQALAERLGISRRGRYPEPGWHGWTNRKLA
jgi:hypothetical protein